MFSDWFVSLSKVTQDDQAPLPAFFVESWVFSSALNVVLESDKWITSSSLDTVSISSASAAKGELLELARIQVLAKYLHYSLS